MLYFQNRKQMQMYTQPTSFDDGPLTSGDFGPSRFCLSSERRRSDSFV